MPKDVGKLELTLPSDTEIAMTRLFEAPRRLVFQALIEPELVKRWLGVQNGWTLDVCEIDARVGGKYRYEWRKGSLRMGMGGVHLEIVAPERIVATELFDDAWYPGEAVDATTLAERDGRTTLVLTVKYSSKEARDIALKTPMEDGVAASYDLLEALLGSPATGAGARARG